MGGLALCGGVDARCVLSRLESALEPLIPFKKFKESTVELRNLRFLEGAIPARSKALVRGLEEDCRQREGGGKAQVEISQRQRHPARGQVLPAHLPFSSPHSFF
jgi:hypothetical protein